jgi:hypothetical protein
MIGVLVIMTVTCVEVKEQIDQRMSIHSLN